MHKGIGQGLLFCAVVIFHVIILGLLSKFQPLNRGGSWAPKAAMLSGYVLYGGEGQTAPEVSNNKGVNLKSDMHGSNIDLSRLAMDQGFGDTSPAAMGFGTQNYKTSDELHTRATPVDQWNIPKHLLPKNAAFAIAFSVWVSETGNVDWVEVLTPLPPSARSIALRSELAKTKMQPATLNDIAVASTMTVEVVLEPNF